MIFQGGSGHPAPPHSGSAHEAPLLHPNNKTLFLDKNTVLHYKAIVYPGDKTLPFHPGDKTLSFYPDDMTLPFHSSTEALPLVHLGIRHFCFIDGDCTLLFHPLEDTKKRSFLKISHFDSA